MWLLTLWDAIIPFIRLSCKVWGGGGRGRDVRCTEAHDWAADGLYGWSSASSQSREFDKDSFVEEQVFSIIIWSYFTDLFAIFVQDIKSIPQHKPKKPVISSMSADVIRKGTLSMVLSAFGDSSQSASEEKPTDENKAATSEKECADSSQAEPTGDTSKGTANITATS